MNIVDAFKILKLNLESDERDIKRAFVKLSKQYHPEEHPETYKKIYEAYKMAVEYVRRAPTIQNEDSPLTNEKSEEVFDYIIETNKIEPSSNFSFDVNEVVDQETNEPKYHFKDKKEENQQYDCDAEEDNQQEKYDDLSFEGIPVVNESIYRYQETYLNEDKRKEEQTTTIRINSGRRHYLLFALFNVIELIVYHSIASSMIERLIAVLLVGIYICISYLLYIIFRKKHQAPTTLVLVSCINFVVSFIGVMVTLDTLGMMAIVNEIFTVANVISAGMAVISIIWLVLWMFFSKK